MRIFLTFLIAVAFFGFGYYVCTQVMPHPVSAAEVTTADSSPSALSVTMNINEDQSASDGKSKVMLQFSAVAIANQNSVQFSHGETVTCNNDGGGPLQFDSNKLAYTARVGPAGDYTCMYQQTSRSTPVLITMPRGTPLRPQFLPSNQSRLTVTYNPNNDPRLKNCSVAVDANGSQTVSSVPNLPDNGQYTIPDISGLSGQGTLVVTRTCLYNASHPQPQCACLSKTDFSAVNVVYKATATLFMTWNPTDP